MMKKNTYTLLIIEDDYYQQELLKIWLEEEAYEVMCAANGEQALEIIAEHKPDLILLDLLMPKVDGFQVARQLKQNPETRQIPVIVVTAVDDQNKRVEVLEIGVDDFLNKPVDRIELLVRVKNLLQSRAYCKQLQARQAHLLQLETMASVGTLITSVTNEINQPLHELQAIVTLAKQYSENNTQLIDLLAKATQYIERIDLITHNTQLYIKSISTHSTEERCDIEDVLGQVLELLTNRMKESNIQIQTDIDADLPLVMCSAEGLMHVLVHLLINAQEALENYPQPCITISIKATEDKHLIVSVCDNNADNTEDMYSLITDPLFNTKLPEVCAGLGLALACHFIENSGGSISINSIEGRGCCMQAVLKTA
jgi:DNA-binding response OmpR family regulator